MDSEDKVVHSKESSTLSKQQFEESGSGMPGAANRVPFKDEGSGMPGVAGRAKFEEAGSGMPGAANQSRFKDIGSAMPGVENRSEFKSNADTSSTQGVKAFAATTAGNGQTVGLNSEKLSDL